MIQISKLEADKRVLEEDQFLSVSKLQKRLVGTFTYRNRPVVVLVPVRKIVGRSGFAIEQAQNCGAGFLLPRKGR